MSKGSPKSAFSVYKATQDARKSSPSGKLTADREETKEATGNGELSDSMVLALLKADLLVGKRKKRKKASMRTELLKKNVARPPTEKDGEGESVRSRSRSVGEEDTSEPPEGPPAKRRRHSDVTRNERASAKVQSSPKESSRSQKSKARSSKKGSSSMHREDEDSRVAASKMFDWLIHPYSAEKFFK